MRARRTSGVEAPPPWCGVYLAAHGVYLQAYSPLLKTRACALWGERACPVYLTGPAAGMGPDYTGSTPPRHPTAPVTPTRGHPPTPRSPRVCTRCIARLVHTHTHRSWT